MATTQKSITLNGVAVSELFSTIEAVKTTPSIARFKFRIRNQWEDGSRNYSTVTTLSGANQELTHPVPFRLEADEPAILLGKDMAANPVEHLLHALASCLTTSMVYHASARGIQINAIESTFEGDLDLHGFLDLGFAHDQRRRDVRANGKHDADGRRDGKAAVTHD